MATDAPPLDYLTLPSSSAQALASLAEPVATWFQQTFAAPTAAQRFAWPVLGRGQNMLLCAPTGTGKTLAAFLPIISQLWDDPVEGLQCLYIAPMKALGRDVGKNLRRHLRAMEESFGRLAARTGQPDRFNRERIRIGLRTGDTSPRARSRHLARPPHILLTTPESLAILLTNPIAHNLFRRLRWIVVDEIHALAGNKRGADLAISLERLQSLKPQITSPKPPGEYSNPAGIRNQQLQPPKPPGEYSNPAGIPESIQRIGLSATCAPIQTIARFLVGTDRPCTIAELVPQTAMDLTIEPLPAEDPDVGFMLRLVQRLEAEITRNRTTLIFTNVRALAERLTWQLKRRFPDQRRRIAVHHSSLAAARRRVVERRMKKGRLDIVVSSTSLELGIDIGNVDGVIFVHPPGGVVRFLQRLGRSGHRPGQTRRGLLLTSGPAELLEATVTAAAARAGQLEPLVPPPHPLDVLCQQLVGMAMTSWWTPDEAFLLVRRAYPFRALSRADFDSALDYLSGKHADGRSWLPSRLCWEGDRFAIVNQRTLRLLRRNLGTIQSEEPRAIRLLLPAQPTTHRGQTPSVMIGSVDDAYADRLRPGDRLLLDGRCFEFRRREQGAMLVDEVSTRPVVPRWTGSGWSLSRALAERLFLFRLQAADALRDGSEHLRRWLRQEYGLGRAACAELADLFMLQETISEIPDARTLLVELIAAEQIITYYFHTPLHRPGNDALARLLTWRLFHERGLVVQTDVADLGFTLAVSSPRTINVQEWRALLADGNFDVDFAHALADCDALRERFAQVATTGLMVLRQPIGGRRKVGGHDWAQRRLFDQVRNIDPHFILLRQAEREIKAEVCDAEAAQTYLAELPRRQIRCRRLCQISPFAAGWTQSAAVAGAVPATRDDLMRSLHAELTTV